jgi:hypothetical protein
MNGDGGGETPLRTMLSQRFCLMHSDDFNVSKNCERLLGVEAQRVPVPL